MYSRIFTAMCILGIASGALAQDDDRPTPVTPVFATTATFVGEFYQRETIEDAPLSARLVTRTVRELCDGNRIVHEQSVLMYRDAQGRVRRETQSPSSGYGSVGGFALPVTIIDPIAGITIVLDQSSKTAYQSNVLGDFVHPGQLAIPAQSVVALGAPTGQSTLSGSAPSYSIGSSVARPPVTISRVMPGQAPGGTMIAEELGESTIQGVSVEGTRYTTTHPANAFGNEQPIVVVKEAWYSTEHQMIIRSEHRDPRMGTVIYAVELLGMDEPDPFLFKVPDDYTMADAPVGVRLLHDVE